MLGSVSKLCDLNLEEEKLQKTLRKTFFSSFFYYLINFRKCISRTCHCFSTPVIFLLFFSFEIFIIKMEKLLFLYHDACKNVEEQWRRKLMKKKMLRRKLCRTLLESFNKAFKPWTNVLFFVKFKKINHVLSLQVVLLLTCIILWTLIYNTPTITFVHCHR